MAHHQRYLLFGFLVIFGVLLLIPTTDVCSWDFQHSVWGPASLLVRGEPPYQFNTPYGHYVAPWWPPVIGANFWMGWLPCQTAAKIWLAFELTGVGLTLWLLDARRKPAPRWVGLALLVFFLFPPLYFHLLLGQFSLLFTALMVALVFSPGHEFPPPGMPWTAAMLIVLGASKPQLAVLIYPGILAVTLQKGAWRGVARLGGAVLAALALYLTPLFIFYPGWVSGFLKVTRYNLGVAWDLPTPFVRLTLQFGPPGVWIWLPLFLGCLGLSMALWIKKGARLGMLWSMALTPLATPYGSSWDFILLLPLFFWQLLNFRSRGARFGLVAGMLAAEILQIIPRLGNKDVTDGSQWWVPPVTLAVFGLAALIERRDAHRPVQQTEVPEFGRTPD